MAGRPKGSKNKKRPPLAACERSRPKRGCTIGRSYVGQAETNLLDSIRDAFNEALETVPSKKLNTRQAPFSSRTLNKSNRGMAVSLVRHLTKAILRAATEDDKTARILEGLLSDDVLENNGVDGEPPSEEMSLTEVTVKFACATKHKDERRLALSLLCKANTFTEVHFLVLHFMSLTFINRLIICYFVILHVVHPSNHSEWAGICTVRSPTMWKLH